MPATPNIRIVLVEDAPTDAELEIRELKRAGLRVAHRVVENEEDFRAALREFAPDLIISDFSMPHFDGMSALALARHLSPETPFIFVSGTIGEEYAIRALKNGATDYVLKTNLVRLPAAVERAVGEARERRQKRRIEAELATARERLDAIFQSLQDVLWSVSLPGEELLYVNPAIEAVYGRPPEAFMANPALRRESIHPADRQRAAEAWAALKQGQPMEIEYRIQRPDGSVRWISDRGMPVRGPDGKPQRLDGLARDISDRMQERARLARLARVREMLSGVNAAIVRLRERKPLLEELCSVAVKVGGWRTAAVALKTGQPHELQIAAYAGKLDQERARSLTTDPAAECGHGASATATREGRTVICNDLANDPSAYRRLVAERDGTGCVGAFALRAEDQVIGAFVIAGREADRFDEDEVRLLEETAANISFALDLIEKRARLDYLALYDPLTELPNRTLFHDRLELAIDAARRSGERLALAVFDIERFQAMNDTYGRHVGDLVLRQFGARLASAIGRDNLIARLSGDHFSAIFPAIRDAADAARGVGDVLRGVQDSLQVQQHELRLSVKAGIAMYPEDGASADVLLRNVEASLVQAKETGEKFLFYAPHINARVAEQVELEFRLREALERHELFLHYQPKVDLITRRIVGVEALLRWEFAGRGLISPAIFVPVLEQTGMILEAGKQVLRRAAADFADWQKKGLAAPRIAVNVSSRQLRQQSFVDDVRAALGDWGSAGVDLEITESLLMEDVDASIGKLARLREAGLNIALDDFGTGFSSLAYLSRLPIDTVKIDRSFVHGMTDNAGDTSIISSIITLAQSLRLKVVAEGVETEQQATLLRLLRCDQMQGFLFCKPSPAGEIEALIRR